MNAEVKNLTDILSSSIMEDTLLVEKLDINEKILKKVLIDHLSKRYVKEGFVNIENIDDDELRAIINLASIESVISSLKSKLLVNEFEGNLFLTDEGKELAKALEKL